MKISNAEVNKAVVDFLNLNGFPIPASLVPEVQVVHSTNYGTFEYPYLDSLMEIVQSSLDRPVFKTFFFSLLLGTRLEGEHLELLSSYLVLAGYWKLKTTFKWPLDMPVPASTGIQIVFAPLSFDEEQRCQIEAWFWGREVNLASLAGCPRRVLVTAFDAEAGTVTLMNPYELPRVRYPGGLGSNDQRG